MRSIGWAASFLPVIAFLVYVLLPTKNYYWDGISFALGIEQTGPLASGRWPGLIHPNHLVYNFFGYFIWLALHTLGVQVRALPILQAISMVCAAICVWLMQRILLRITGSPYVSVTLAAIFAFSAVFWKYSTDAEAYIPSVMFLLLAFYLLVRTSRPQPIAIGLAHCGAMMIHQLAVLFFPAAAWGIYRREGWRGLWRYSVIAAGVTLPAYYAGYCLQRRGGPVPRFSDWLTNHSPDSSFTFGLVRNLGISVSGYVRLFVGGTGRVLQYLGPFMALTLAALTIVLGVLVLRLVRYRGELKFLRSQRTPEVFFDVAIVWFAAYFIFLLFWLPQNTFYKLFCLPALIVMLAHLAQRFAGPRRGRLALFAAVLALANLALYIYPYSHADYNQSLRFARRMQPMWSERTVVYYRVFTVNNWFIKYFNPETTWQGIAPQESAAAVADSAAREIESGKDVWLDGTADEFLRTNGVTPGMPEDKQEDDFAKHPIWFQHWTRR